MGDPALDRGHDRDLSVQGRDDTDAAGVFGSRSAAAPCWRHLMRAERLIRGRPLCLVTGVAFFLVAVLLRMFPAANNGVAVSTAVIVGYFLVALFNPLVNLIYLVLLIRRKLFISLPRWLVMLNFIFLLLQLQYILFLNDTFHS